MNAKIMMINIITGLLMNSISENADTPLKVGLSLLGTSHANYADRAEDASEEIIPLIEDRKKVLGFYLLSFCLFSVWVSTAT